MNRRGFLQLLGASGAVALTASCHRINSVAGTPSSPPSLIRFPEKREMILLTDCPPQLETPLHYFRQNLTPNEAFFVQWHVAGVPTHVDTGAEPDKVSRTTAGNGARAPGPERKYSGHGDAAMGSTNERR